VPYPGKYLEASLSADTVNIGDPVHFTITVKNLGLEPLNEIGSTISIFENADKLGSIETDTVSLQPQESAELQGEWLTTKGGKFRAIADVFYDEFSTTAETMFTVGQLIVNIKNIEYADIVAGTIGKISIAVESKWNAQITDIYDEMFIYAADGKVLADVQGNPFSLSALGKYTDTLYWDTKNIQPGAYTGRVILHYAGQTTEQDFKINVVKMAQFDNLYIMIIVLLIIAFIILTIYLKLSTRKQKRRRK
jgi:hypothetical protein